MDFDAQAKYIYQMLDFMQRAEPMLQAYEAHVAAETAAAVEVDAEDDPKVEGSGTTDGVEGAAGEPVAEDAPKAEAETAAVEEQPAETTKEPAAEQAPVAEEPAPVVDAQAEVAQEEPAVETEETKPAV